jgi:hypothetical protein
MTSRGRAVAALGAYLCLSAQLLGLVHVLVVRHATCPSHGELTHGVERAAPVALPVATPARTAGAALPAVEHQDEHCLTLAARRRELALLAPAPVALVAFSPAPRLTAGEPPRPAPAVVLRLAPKTSPPV